MYCSSSILSRIFLEYRSHIHLKIFNNNSSNISRDIHSNSYSNIQLFSLIEGGSGEFQCGEAHLSWEYCPFVTRVRYPIRSYECCESGQFMTSDVASEGRQYINDVYAKYENEQLKNTSTSSSSSSSSGDAKGGSGGSSSYSFSSSSSSTTVKAM